MRIDVINVICQFVPKDAKKVLFINQVCRKSKIWTKIALRMTNDKIQRGKWHFKIFHQIFSPEFSHSQWLRVEISNWFNYVVCYTISIHNLAGYSIQPRNWNYYECTLQWKEIQSNYVENYLTRDDFQFSLK